MSRRIGSDRVVNPTTASSPSSTAGRGPVTWPRLWRPPTRRVPVRRCQRAISYAGAGKCSTCWTRYATLPRILICGLPPNALSMTSGAASSQLTPGRLGRSYGYIRQRDSWGKRHLELDLKKDLENDERTARVRPEPVVATARPRWRSFLGRDHGGTLVATTADPGGHLGGPGVPAAVPTPG